jgi:hypothetical protein
VRRFASTLAVVLLSEALNDFPVALLFSGTARE